MFYHLKTQKVLHPAALPGRDLGGKSISVILSGDYGDIDTKINIGICSNQKTKISNFLYGLYNGPEDYTIMKETLIPPLKNQIKSLQTKKLVVIPIENLGSYELVIVESSLQQVEFIYKNEEAIGVRSTEDLYFDSPIPIKQLDEESVYEVPFEFFISGDIKWLFLLEARATYCGKNCPFCFSKQSEWKDCNQRFSSLSHEIVKTKLVGKPRNNYGFDQDECLLDIPFDHWICPLLHIELGIVSFLVSTLFEFCEKNIETVSLWK